MGTRPPDAAGPPRSHRRWTSVLPALAVIVLLLLAACGGGAPEGETEPVEDELGFDLEGTLARQARVENLIRDCMKAQGFEYVPVDPAAQRAELLGAPGMTEEDFNKQFGYGITTLYQQRRRQRAQVGPNEAYRDGLSEAERVAYDRALFGEHPDATFAEAIDHGDFTRLGGCTKQAADEVFGGADVVQTLQQQLDELDDRILADSRMVDAIAAWSRCMRVAGYDFADPEQVDTFLIQRLEAIIGPAEQTGEGEVEPTYDQAALAALQRDEVVIVATDINCEETHIEPVEEEVRAEYEREFREENAGLLSRVPPP